MDLGLEGRVAVVTGGTRGFGALVVARLEAEGARAIPIARSTGIDITDADAGARVLDAAGGQVDILVNNAGIASLTDLDDLTDADWQLQYELNVLGPLRLTQACAPGMIARGWGRVVNVSSSSGKRPSQTNAAYSVTKAAQLSLSRALADRYAGTGVLVNAVTPGAAATDMWLGDGGLGDQAAAARGVTRDEAVAAQAAKIPLGTLLDPDDIASVIVFLCSDRAGAVTGAAWSADGGTVPIII